MLSLPDFPTRRVHDGNVYVFQHFFAFFYYGNAAEKEKKHKASSVRLSQVWNLLIRSKTFTLTDPSIKKLTFDMHARYIVIIKRF